VASAPWAALIRRRREELQRIAPGSFTRAEVARRVGVTERTLWAWETGQNKPHPRSARRLARVLGKSLVELGLEPNSHEHHLTS
jgi:transcriptional regulator with XRE-family HTH domain